MRRKPHRVKVSDSMTKANYSKGWAQIEREKREKEMKCQRKPWELAVVGAMFVVILVVCVLFPHGFAAF